MKRVWAFLKKCTPVIRLTTPDGRRGIFIGIRWTW